MPIELLTLDNTHLSGPKNAALSQFSADNFISDEAVGLIEASISENTRRAYEADLAHFAAWGGHLSADPGTVASYLAAHVETLSVATLVRRVATLSKAHEAKRLPNPCRSEIVRATLRGIKRLRGVAQRKAKQSKAKQSLFFETTCFGCSMQ